MRRLLWQMFYARWNRATKIGNADIFDCEFIPSVIGNPIVHWLEDADDCERVHKAIEVLEDENLVHRDDLNWVGDWDDNRYFQ